MLRSPHLALLCLVLPPTSRPSQGPEAHPHYQAELLPGYELQKQPRQSCLLFTRMCSSFGSVVVTNLTKAGQGEKGFAWRSNPGQSAHYLREGNAGSQAAYHITCKSQSERQKDTTAGCCTAGCCTARCSLLATALLAAALLASLF